MHTCFNELTLRYIFSKALPFLKDNFSNKRYGLQHDIENNRRHRMVNIKSLVYKEKFAIWQHRRDN